MPLPNSQILCLCSNRWASAIAEYAFSTSLALRSKGVSTTHIVLKNAPLAKKLKDAGFTVTEVSRFGLVAAFVLLFRLIKFKPSQLLVFGGPEQFLAMLWKPLFGFRLGRFFGDAEKAAQKFQSKKFRSSLKVLDQLILPSKKLASFFANLTDRAACIPLGSRDDLFHFTGVPRKSRPTALIFGRFDPIKGHQYAIEIFALMLKNLPKNLPRPQLRIVGLPANISIAQLEGIVAQYDLKLGDDVWIEAAKISDVNKMMQSVHVGWVPSIGSELIGRVTQEFLLSGTSVFLSGVGSLEECLFADAGESYNYPVLPKEEVATKLAHRLITAFNEPEQQRQQRAQIAKDHFALDIMANRLVKVLTQSNSSG